MKRQRTLTAVIAIGLLGAMSTAGCSDSDYDFDNIDLTMGFGSDSLTVPLSSSNDLPLADILELEEGGSVRADETTGWDYVFHLAGGEVAAAHPCVEPVVAEATSASVGYDVVIGSAKSGPRRVATSVSIAPKTLVEYTYQGDAKEVVSITRATVDATTLTVGFTFPTVLQAVVPTIKRLTLSFPDYLQIGEATGSAATVSGSTVTLSNVVTGSPLSVAVTFRGIDFSSYDPALGSLTLADGHITLSGTVKMGLDFDVDPEALAGLADTRNLGTISATLSTTRMTLRSAAGRFDPHVALDNLGEVDVTGVPDFLGDGNVVADLDNPQIVLGIDNDMDIAANITGDVIASKDGRTTTTIHLTDLHIDKQKSNRLCICRKKTAEIEAAYGSANVYEVSNLSDLVRTIPDHLKFTNVEVRADLSQDASIEFGKRYTVKPSYEVTAPLAFGEDAMIVYKDTLDGWNDDVDDLQLSDDAYVLVTCDVVSKLPVHLTVAVTPIDKSGRPISESKIKVDVPTTVIASSDGQTPAVTSISAKVTQLDEDALRELGGMTFTITGAATHDGRSVAGITLNAKKHTLRMQNIKATVVGRVIGDFN